MQIENITILTADEGKTFQRVSDGEILGNKLTLGVNDTKKNYKEIVYEEEAEIDGSI